jgi:ABC-2 type transport system permease protein
MGKALRFLAPSQRALVIKDIKLFCRDPLQWSQFVIFFGLLAFYFANLRNISYDLFNPFWKNIISFLNLMATALTLASLNARFVFPLISMEGKRFWLIGLAPVKFKHILYEKFWLSALAGLVITETLINLSNYLLGVSPFMLWLGAGLVMVFSFTLAGLSVGLGACFPNFKEDNPAAIFSGFGGTLTLVLSLIYLGMVVISLAFPIHLYFTQKIVSLSTFYFYLFRAFILIVFASVVFCAVPLTAGLRRLKSMEF